jgi:uncharacterized protein with HEPN domain
MSSKLRKWKYRLHHIIEAIEKIQTYTAGMSFVDFIVDAKTIDAVSNNIIVIGEATRHIPSEIETAYPDIPWSKMKALRNIMAHEYDRIDKSILWMVVQEDLPPLIDELKDVDEETMD